MHSLRNYQFIGIPHDEYSGHEAKYCPKTDDRTELRRRRLLGFIGGHSIAARSDMNCPVCNVDLKMGDRQGVEVNYCPTCRGIWLDGGSLDKIIDRCMQMPERRTQERYRDEDYRDRHQDHEHEGHRRKSFLSNLFD